MEWLPQSYHSTCNLTDKPLGMILTKHSCMSSQGFFASKEIVSFGHVLGHLCYAVRPTHCAPILVNQDRLAQLDRFFN